MPRKDLTMYCPECRSIVADVASFCAACGRVLTGDASGSPVAVQERAKLRLLPALGVALLVLATATGTCAAFGP